MIELFYGLFCLAVLALVVGCLVYVFVTRDQGKARRVGAGESTPPSRAAAKKASELSGSYRLSDLERLFEQLAATEAWGMVLELQFTRVQEDIQMTVGRNAVELCAPSLEPHDTDLFRRAARETGLEARAGSIEGQCCVDVTGAWPKIAGAVRSLCKSIYGVRDGEEVLVQIF